MDMPTLIILTFALLVLHIVLSSVSHDGVILRKGESFSVSEKKKILIVLDKLETYYKKNKKYNTFSIGMCGNLQRGIEDCVLYNKLCRTYHNPEYYRKMGLKTNIHTTSDGFWWNDKDFASRHKATLILKNAIIND